MHLVTLDRMFRYSYHSTQLLEDTTPLIKRAAVFSLALTLISHGIQLEQVDPLWSVKCKLGERPSFVIDAGDIVGHAGQILEVQSNQTFAYIKSIPLQWFVFVLLFFLPFFPPFHFSISA